MGTTWSVTYVADKAADSALAPQEVQAGIEQVLSGVNLAMSTYLPESEISRFNALAVGEPVRPSAAFLAVLQTALAVGELSEGAYDVTVGPLVELWGFGATGARVDLPAQSLIAATLENVGQAHLELSADGTTLRKRRPVALDFSSLAKGFAVDAVAGYLREHGITDFLAEVGGEMVLSGSSPRGDHWQIAIEQPEPGARAVAAALRLTNVSVATSGDYRNFFQVDGKRYSHAIDPHTGYPVDHELVSVTVLHNSTMQADAWATALIVLGLDRAIALAEAQGLAVYCIAERSGEFVHRYSTAIEPFIMAQE